MSTPPRAPHALPPASPRPAPLYRRAWFLAALAFAAGLLLFLLLWSGQREDAGFFRAGQPAAGTGGDAFEPLPTPDAEAVTGPGDVGPNATGEGSGVTGLGGDTGGELEPPPPAAPLPGTAAPPPPIADAGPDASARPVRSPQPRYPPEAMRRGESGTVLLQVHVDAEGRPERVDVVQSSRSRALDREARQTVEGWRFSPAIRGGRPVPSKVLIPIDFKP